MSLLYLFALGAPPFPGDVDASAARIEKSVVINGDYEGIHGQYAYGNPQRWGMRSTGLYAPPGETIRITLPDGFAPNGLGVLLGAHLDDLSQKESPARDSVVTVRVTLGDGATEVSNPHGGLIYITVDAGAKRGLVDVVIEGGIDAPLFVAGETPLEAWNQSIRTHPAPWGELASSKIILTLPSDLLRTLKNPDEVLAFWDRVLDADADLSGFSRDRARPERIVVDIEISAGWMHSGYPVMAPLSTGPDLLNLERLTTEGDWGFFHELGHNHQWMDWTVPGTTETGCNLFTVYVYETVVGKHRNETHGAVSLEERTKRTRAYLADPDISRWSVWVALDMYLLLQDEFGWEAFTNVFTEYRDKFATERPQDAQEKWDMFAVRFSREVGWDISPFLLSWDWPLSESALRDVAHLPPWSGN